MGSSAQHDVTRILMAVEGGDEGAAARLLPLVYDELRRLAHQRMAKEAPRKAPQPTSLVHQAYLLLVADADVRLRIAPIFLRRPRRRCVAL